MNLLLVGDFNNSLSEMDRCSQKKINKDIIELNNTMNQLDIFNYYKFLHSKTAECTFLTSPYEILTKID